MLLREEASIEIRGLVKAHGTSSMEECDSHAGLILTRLLESNGTGSEFQEWFWRHFGRNVKSRPLFESLRGYWRFYLKSRHVI